LTLSARGVMLNLALIISASMRKL